MFNKVNIFNSIQRIKIRLFYDTSIKGFSPTIYLNLHICRKVCKIHSQIEED